MKRILLLAIGIAGLVATVFALRGSGAGPEKKIDYYANGQIQTESLVKDGVRQGLSHRYWADGKPQAEGAYEGGTMSGHWTFWNQDGHEDADRSGEYVDGKRVGG